MREGSRGKEENVAGTIVFEFFYLSYEMPKIYLPNQLLPFATRGGSRRLEKYTEKSYEQSIQLIKIASN